MVEVDDPATQLAVEALRPFHVGDRDRDQLDLVVHGAPPWWVTGSA